MQRRLRRCVAPERDSDAHDLQPEPGISALLSFFREIAGKSPDAIRGAKRLFEQSGRVPLAQQYADERTEIGQLIGRPNQIEAVTAFFEKRPAVFTDPA